MRGRPRWQMSETGDTTDETSLLLHAEHATEKFSKFVPALSGTAHPVIRGVAARLQHWPSDLLLAFLVACLIIGCLMLLIALTIAACLSGEARHASGAVEGLSFPTAPSNVYFLKLENRTWSTREFCYIETAARKHADLNVYMINLTNRKKDQPDAELPVEDLSPAATGRSTAKPNLQERNFRTELAARYANVRNVDVTVDRLFMRSKLGKFAAALNDDVLELAARTLLLWTSPGIALNPSMYCHLKPMEEIVCNGTVRECDPDQLTTIELENDIQATGLPCQAFLDFLMRQILKNRLDSGYTLKSSVREYCPRLYDCPEIRILDLDPRCPSDDVECPVVYRSTVLHDEPLFVL